MGIQAGVGVSHHRNPKVASQEATDDAPLCGCSGERIIAGDQADQSNLSVAVITIRSDQLPFSNGIVTGLNQDPAKAGRAIAKAIQPKVSSDTLALSSFPDGITVNFDRLVAGLEGQLNLDHLLPLVGGTAGDNLEFKRTYQYANDQVVSDGVAWALLSGGAQIAWAVNHGRVPVGVEYKVTHSEGNVIYQIDGRPALEVLRDYLTDDELEDWAKTLMTFSFGFKAPGHMRAYDEYIIRGMLGGKDDATGSITIPTEVSEGTRIWMTRRDYEKLANGIVRATEEIKAQLGEESARLVFQFDCAGRGKAILREQQKLQLLKMLRQQVGPEVPWLGFYTFGEIAPVGAENAITSMR